MIRLTIAPAAYAVIITAITTLERSEAQSRPGWTTFTYGSRLNMSIGSADSAALVKAS